MRVEREQNPDLNQLSPAAGGAVFVAWLAALLLIQKTGDVRPESRVAIQCYESLSNRSGGASELNFGLDASAVLHGKRAIPTKHQRASFKFTGNKVLPIHYDSR